MKKVAILATARPERVMQVHDKYVRNHHDVAHVICTPESQAWRFQGEGRETWIFGEDRLPLDGNVAMEVFGKLGFNQVVIPIDLFPLHPLLYVERFLRRATGVEFILDGSPLFRTSNRRWIRLFLILYSFFLYAPVGILMRFARNLDGALLLLIQLAARPARWFKRRSAQPIVCHVITSFATGGAQRQLLTYLESAPQHHEDLKVIALFAGNKMFQKAYEATGVDVEVLEERLLTTALGTVLISGLRHTTIAIILWRRLFRYRPSCTYSWLFVSNVIAAPAAAFAGVPRIVSSVRNLSSWKAWPEYRRWWYRSADRFSSSLNDAIVGNSQAVVDDYRQWSGEYDAPYHVIPNAIDPSTFLRRDYRDLRSELGIDRQSVVVLNVGRLAAEKNHALLLRCCRRLLDEGLDFRLVIVGHGEVERELRDMCVDLELGDIVVFFGKDPRPHDHYFSADIFALSSTIEGMPNVLLEAQLFGLPVVTTNAGGSAEVVEDGVSGFVVPLDDEVGFAGRLHALICDPDLRESMGGKARERILSQFTVGCLRARIDRLSHRIEPVE